MGPARIADRRVRMNRKTLSGKFNASRLNERLWRLSRDAGAAHAGAAHAGAAHAEVYLIGAAVPDGAIERIEIDWAGDAVDVTLTMQDSTQRIRARAVYIHEPRPDVHDRLPLETFGPRARAFWKRIFLLVRIPGGSALLSRIARRTRA